MTKNESLLLLMAKKVGNAVKKMAGEEKKKKWSWYTPLMAAASDAISRRISSVDFVLDLRDARIPLSSECELLKRLSSSSSSRRIVVLNKVDLASRSYVKFLNFLQGQVRALRKSEPERHTITMMLVGIPNVGKSALANSLHQIGRISAAEKGKLKHAVVSPLPGETKGICSLKVASHPNIYVLDTPGILPPQIIDADVCAKLALTGAFNDSLAGEKALAEFLLAVLNLSYEYQKWEKLSTDAPPPSRTDDNVALHHGSFENRNSKGVSTDHTKDCVVLSVRKSLFEVASSFRGNLQDEDELLRLIQAEFVVLREAFNLPTKPEEETDHKVAVKLLNLFRTGRLGHHTLDSIPINLENDLP
ncbi:DAR GTPase 2, mitochondrial isoform X2 [Beta vulgaris subsp. vulgaris]|uniref:DAR GTPase 2, mitochondrial isoform X2 n=1 Tax=Beta vulgaris subsp. vulgaris TaxID=3555 RepID=UPI002036E238|nr:DAR GTPase 2, mitochondrial isoform X2 [Beta vulgaris subsp. vulgaris]